MRIQKKHSNEGKINLLDLFSGMGGFALAFQRAGYGFGEHYFSETDPYAVSNYLYNFKHSINLGDVKTINTKSISRPSVITFGSPCEDFSVAGKKAGIEGERSGLFFEAVKIIKRLRPDVFIFENVKGLLSSNGGADFKIVLQAFADIGLYDLQWQLLNTLWFLPQNRERLYLVGILRGKPRTQIFPITGSPFAIEKNRAKSKTTCSKKAEVIVPEGRDVGVVKAYYGDSIDLSFLHTAGRRGRVSKGIIKTIRKGTNLFTPHPKGLRHFTPDECEALQGYDRGWSAYGLKNGERVKIADYRRYKLIGNALSLPVAQLIALKLRPVFGLPDLMPEHLFEMQHRLLNQLRNINF